MGNMEKGGFLSRIFKGPKKNQPVAPVIQSEHAVPENLPAVSEESSREIQSHGESIAVKNVLPLKDAFPKIEIMREEDEKPNTEKMPSASRMDKISSNEPIWLTHKAVKERLDVLLHTNPIFSEKGKNAVALTREMETPYKGEVGTIQYNMRRPNDPNDMIEVFQQMGYKIVEDEEKNIGMVVDATIPAEDNTNGRYTKKYLGHVTHPARGTVVETEAILPKDLGKIGIRPASDQSSHGIVIPLETLIKMHKEPTGIGDAYFNQDQSGKSAYEISGKNWHLHMLVNIVMRTFNKLKGDASYRLDFMEINDLSKAGKSREAKEKMFELLSRLGLRPHLTNGGYFPFEPNYFINYNISGGEEGLKKFKPSADSLKDLQKQPRHPAPWLNLYLDDLLILLEKSYKIGFSEPEEAKSDEN